MAPQPPPIDHYEALQLSRDATPSQIRGSYHRLARKLHPDRRRRRNGSVVVVNGGDDDGDANDRDADDHEYDHHADHEYDDADHADENDDEKFRHVQDAYECLIDPRRRQGYDDALRTHDLRARSRRKKAVPLEASECRWEAVEEEEGEGRPSSVGGGGIRPTASGQLDEDEPHMALVYTCRCGEDLYPLEDYALEDDGQFLDCRGCSAVYNVSSVLDMLPVPPSS